MESKLFVERRKSLQKSRRKIMAAYHCNCGRRPRLLPKSRFEGDEEIVYLHCDAARHYINCDGLVCFSEQDWITLFNPSTRQLCRLPTGFNLFEILIHGGHYSLGGWAMGFGRDKVTESYKVVRMCFYFPKREFSVLDVETGEWRNLSSPPSNVVTVGSKPVCVNGSIYWLHMDKDYKLLALDLHKEEFHGVSVPARWITYETQIVNLEDRLALAKTRKVGPEWMLEILSMDAEKERWSNTYSIRLTYRVGSSEMWNRWFTPVAVSKQGNLVFCDNYNRLFKYYPGTDEIRCLSSDICVISPYSENLAPLPFKSSHPHPVPVNSDFRMRTCRCHGMKLGS